MCNRPARRPDHAKTGKSRKTGPKGQPGLRGLEASLTEWTKVRLHIISNNNWLAPNRADRTLLIMSNSVEKIVSEALQLPVGIRAYVAERLLESLDADPGGQLSPAWVEEVRARCREIDAGIVTLRDADDVFAKAYSTLE